ALSLAARIGDRWAGRVILPAWALLGARLQLRLQVAQRPVVVHVDLALEDPEQERPEKWLLDPVDLPGDHRAAVMRRELEHVAATGAVRLHVFELDAARGLQRGDGDLARVALAQQSAFG